MSNTLGSQLRNLRTNAKMTQAQLAQATGLSVSSIKCYENNLREPNSKAMAALESFFNVTGEYLRGESNNSDSQYVWQNKEVMNAVKENFPFLLDKLLNSVLHNTELEQKMLFDILLELYHVSTQKNCSPEFKQAAFILMQNISVNVTRYIDFCRQLPQSDLEKERLNKLRSACIDEYSKALAEFEKKVNLP